MSNNPEQRVTKTGNTVTNFRVSVKKRMPAPDGRKYDYYNCVAFNKVGDTAYKYLNSNSRVAIDGTLDTTSWTDRNTGAKRYNTQIVCDNIEILQSTVNAGDRMPQQDQPQVPDITDNFTEVPSDDVDLPFI